MILSLSGTQAIKTLTTATEDIIENSISHTTAALPIVIQFGTQG